EAGDFRVNGHFGDLISDGYEPPNNIPLDQGVFGPGRFWPDDISNNGGTITWDYTAHVGGGDCGGVRCDEAQSAAHTGYPGYRMVYEAWAHEMMGTWNPPNVDPIRSDIMDKSLIWLGPGPLPFVTLLQPTGGETISGPYSIQWTAVDSQNTKLYYSQNNAQAWHLLYEDVTGTATNYVWDTTCLDDGTDYRIKVLVTGDLNLTNYDVSGTFSLSNGVDNTGPMVVAGSVKIDPQPTYTPASATLTATITDVGRGNSNIAAAEYFINTIGADCSGSAMSTVLPPFNDLTEDVTASVSSALPDGDHIIYVHGQDAAGNWGSYQTMIWHVVNPNPPPVVTVTYPTAADIVESGTFDIAWDATDVGTAYEDLWIDIYYSIDSGSTWIPIDSGLFNTPAGSGTYSWATVSDGVNYLIRVNATDDDIIIPMIGKDKSDNPFSIDNVYYNPPGMYPDRWYFQAVPPVELSMHPVELTANEISVPIDSAGDFSLGTWQSAPMTEVTDIAGQWDFSVSGYVTVPGL
ncbi:MAG: hypothetical protein KAX31_06810, partial [Thermoplasmata archaeon]|nr:hypothetical protein [Thermoplasmata archaeon]